MGSGLTLWSSRRAACALGKGAGPPPSQWPRSWDQEGKSETQTPRQARPWTGEAATRPLGTGLKGVTAMGLC